MWYVIQTETGKEEAVAELVKLCVDKEIYEKCFCPKREFLKRLGGQWLLQKAPLFPGYFFIVTEQPQQLFHQLKGTPGLTKLLGDEGENFIPLKPEEEAYYRALLNSGEGETIGLSGVWREEEGGVCYIDGPLKELKKDVLKINMRKRYAVVRATMLGEERTMLLGIHLERDKEGRELENYSFEVGM